MRWLLKRWWFWAGTGFMVVAVCAGYLLIPVERSRITQANFDKIQVGMTQDQIESLLGKPQDSFPVPLAFSSRLHSTWSDDDGNEIVVVFNAIPYEVRDKQFEPTELPMWKRVQRRIERRIKALWP